MKHNTLQPVSSVWKTASQLILPVIKAGWLSVLCIWMAAMLVIYVDHIFLKPVYINVGLSVLGFLIVLFFLGVLLLQSQQVMSDSDTSFCRAWRLMCRRALSYYSTAFLLMTMIVGYFYVGEWAIHHFVLGAAVQPSHKQSSQALLYFMLGVVTPLIVIIVFCLFALPFVVLDACKPLKAIMRSYQLVGRHWVRVFFIYGVLGMMLILTIPTTLHAHFLMKYHVYPFFVLLVYLVCFPFISNLIVLMKALLAQDGVF